MKILKIGLLTAIFALLGANFAPVASAQYYYGRTPYLTVSGQSGNNLTFNVSNADPNSRVILYARNTGGTLWSTSIDSIGQTDGSGYLNTFLNPGISGSAEFKVTVNGADSNIAQSGYGGCGYQGCGGCTYNCGTPYGFSLSQNSINLTAGQSLVVTANNSYGGSLYVSSNSNSSVASYTVSGNQITIYGITSGSATINVCASGSGAACASVYVTVSGSSTTGNVWFSPSSPSMYVGQSLAVSINSSAYATGLYGSSSYYVSSNSNSSVVTASVSGTVLNLYANQSGSTTISVCHNSLGYCGSLYVTVTGGSGTGNLWLSQTNVNLSSSQNQTITINSSNPSAGAYYISSQSSYNVVTASISSNSLYLNAQNSGNSTIMVCQYNTSACATLYVVVSGGSGYGNIWFSPSSVNMTSGQTTNVFIYSSGGYGSGYYISSNSNSFVAAANISGSQINLTAQNSGSTTIMVCQVSNSSSCGNITVNVIGSSGGSYITFSQNNLNLTSGQSANVTVYGNGSYYVSSNSNSNVASASLTGNTINIYANNSGNSAVVICQNNPYGCGTLMINVTGSGGYGGTLYFNSTTLPVMVLGQYYNYQLQVSGGSTPYTFQVISGQLPNGLYLNSSGLIYGTPQNSSNSSFSIRVNDNYGRNSTASFTISGSGGGVLGNSTYPNGQLVKENGTVYIMYRGQKSGFSSGVVFTNFGFKFGNVLNIGYSNIPNTGYVINNSNTSHPWGAWVQSGQAIYFVHQDGLIPVPSWDVFINNRGQSSFVVPANIYDFQRTILSSMVNNDSRLY